MMTFPEHPTLSKLRTSFLSTVLTLLAVTWLHLPVHVCAQSSLPDCTFAQQSGCVLEKFPVGVLTCLNSNPDTRARCNQTMFCHVANWQYVKSCFERVPCNGLQYDGRQCTEIFTDCSNSNSLNALCVSGTTTTPSPPGAGSQAPTTPPPATNPFNARGILMEFYNATSGPTTWLTSTNWGSTVVSHCQWFGVGCRGGTEDVVRLSLSRNLLRGTVPQSLADMWTLEILDLSENLLSGDISHLSRLFNIRRLVLGERLLTSVCVFPYQGPGMEDCEAYPDGGQMFGTYTPLSNNDFSGNVTSFFALTQLTHFTLRSPMLALRFGEGLCQWTSLQYLFVRYMPFVNGYIPDCLPVAMNQSLVSFVATDNSIGGTIPNGFGYMHRLLQLAMSFNQLTGTLPPYAPNIMQYVFASNQLTGALPEAQPYSSPDGVMISNLLEAVVVYSNRLTGTLPASYSTMRNLKYFWISANELSGTVPESWRQLDLLMLAMDRNRVGGPISDLYADWGFFYEFRHVPPPYCQSCIFGSQIPTSVFPLRYGTVILRLAQNQFTGVLPPRIRTMPMLYDIELSGNQLSGDISNYVGGTWPMENFKIANNQITGNLHDATALCSMTAAVILDLGRNRIAGSFPPCIGQLQNVVRLLLNDNQLSGTLEPNIGLLSNARILNFAHNQLSGIVPATFSRLRSLATFDVSFNRISGEVYFNLNPFSLLPAMTSINFQNNSLVREISFFLLVGVGSDTKWEACKSWNLANNQIVGTIPFTFDQYAQQLSYINLEGNMIEGVIPDFPRLDVVLLKNNRLQSPSATLPSFLRPTEFFQQSAPTYSCPVISGTRREMVVSLDPFYFNYSFCRCDRGFFGNPPNCRRCLHGGICDSGNKMLIPPGKFPTPTAEEPTHLIDCQENPSATELNNCNPFASLNFSCKEGTRGRLCGDCEDGYYQKQSRCLKCPSLTISIVIVAVAFVLLCIGGLFLMLFESGRKQLILLGKTLIVYMQFGSVIITKTGLRWPSGIITINFAFDVSSVSLGFFSCLTGNNLIDLSVEAQALSFAVVVLFIVAAIFCVFVLVELFKWIQQNERDDIEAGAAEEEWDDLASDDLDVQNAQVYYDRDKSVFETKDETVKSMKPKFLLVRGTVTLLRFLYLPITTGILQMFQCEEDPGLGKRYLTFNPARECSFDDGVYQRNFILACILIPLYVLGFPAFVVFIGIRYEMREKVARNVWFFLFNDYRSGSALFLLWSLGRQLLLSIIAVLIPQQFGISLNLMVVLFAIMLLVNISLSPYKVAVQNFQETVAFAALGLTLAFGMANTSLVESQDTFVGVILVLVQVAFAIALLYSILLHSRLIPAQYVPWFPYYQYITQATNADPQSPAASSPLTPPGTSPSGSPASPSLSPTGYASYRGSSLRELLGWLGVSDRILNAAKRSPFAQEDTKFMLTASELRLLLRDVDSLLQEQLALQHQLRAASDAASSNGRSPCSLSANGSFSAQRQSVSEGRNSMGQSEESGETSEKNQSASDSRKQSHGDAFFVPVNSDDSCVHESSPPESRQQTAMFREPSTAMRRGSRKGSEGLAPLCLQVLQEKVDQLRQNSSSEETKELTGSRGSTSGELASQET